MLATCPGQRATVLLAFAFTGGMPRNSNVGKETKLPPPATALIAPARSAAKNRIVAWKRFMNGKSMLAGEQNPFAFRHRVQNSPCPLGRQQACYLTRDPPKGAWIKVLRGGGCGKPA